MPTIPTIPEDATMEEKVDRILKMMSALVKSQEKVVVLEKKVTKLENTVSTLVKEVHTLKDQINGREQQSRGCNLMLFGLSTSEDDNLIKKVYDKIVKPVLTAAKNKGEGVPTLPNTLVDAFRVRVNSSKNAQQKPPPVIFKFVNPSIRLAFLKAKKEHMPSPAEADKSLGTKKYVVVEDLTGPTYKKLKELQAEERVDKAWSIDGRLRFTLKNDQQIRKVKSVYDSVDSILSV
jgi:hypothetical protein